MSDDWQNVAQQIGRLEAKVDMALVEIARIGADRKECRAHCDSEMPKVHERISDLGNDVHERITNVKGDVDRMAGFLSVHHWLLLVAELAGLGAMVYLGMGHK